MGFTKWKLNNDFIKIHFDGLKMLEESSGNAVQSVETGSHNVSKLVLQDLKVDSGRQGADVPSNRPHPQECPGSLRVIESTFRSFYPSSEPSWTN